jgi:4-hydroxybenzoate polyprenyltransferase
LRNWKTVSGIDPYWRLMRLDRPIGSLLILWPTLTALWLAAGGWPSIGNLLIFTVGVFVMRSAGCVINDFADRKIDGAVQRTAQRPLATGELNSRQALALFILLLAIALGLVSLTNPLTIKLSLVGALLCAIYPFMKRFTHLPQLILGLAMNWGVVMAYAAESGTLSPKIFVFYAATIAWTVAYDTYYAMVDREDDLKIGVKSIAILFGEYDRTMIGMLQMMTVLALLLTGTQFELGIGWYAGVFVVALLFYRQQKTTRNRDHDSRFRAFLNNNQVGIAFFLGIVVESSRLTLMALLA